MKHDSCYSICGLVSIHYKIHLRHLYGCDHLVLINPFTLRGALETIVCYSHTFDNNLGIKRKFTKYLKEICCLAADQHFSFIVFSEYAFVS